ncbi:MAG TPA: hypothetical protein VIK33_19980 [Anaerolineae bacterium]
MKQIPLSKQKRSNSRPEQNQRNRPKNSNNRSGYKGVMLERKSGKWKMYITALYDAPEEAARMYDKLARILFGEYARTNFDAPDLI